MARKISQKFLDELKTGALKPLLQYVQNDHTLDLELRGSKITIYYRGGNILEVKDNGAFISLNKKYLSKTKAKTKPSLQNFTNYFPQAKHAIDNYVSVKRNHLWEKEIQQRIVQENNYSPNASDTDFFIIDIEYQDTGRADIVALKWDSTTPARKLQNNYLPTITIFEVKQGCKAISGKSGMESHLCNFKKFCANTENVNHFKQDMIDVFEQKRELDLIKINGNKNKITKVAANIDFVFLLTNYKSASKKLQQELGNIGNCNFAYANPMGYGLCARNIIDKQEYVKRFL
ncbi:MAG: hypothetical protein LBU90_00660 [Bacteroidales bacterium]|jgi:hypothetical protein|nr:hypothetical protein [Bacteroidales bacterium]